MRVTIETSVGVNYPVDPRRWTWEHLVRLLERRTTDENRPVDGTRFSVEALDA